MFQKWNDMGQGHFKLSVQNLYDSAAKAEGNSKTLKDYMDDQRAQPLSGQDGDFEQGNDSELAVREDANQGIELDGARDYANLQEPQALREHDRPAPNTMDPPTSAWTNNEEKEICSVLLDKATKICNKIYNDEMKFKERLWSTKARNIPTIKDQEICNEVTEANFPVCK